MKKTITLLAILSLIMPYYLVSSVWASQGAADDSAICDKGSSVLIDVLSNDTALSNIGAVSSPKHGTAVIENGKIRYTPDPNWYGIDSFTYSATKSTDKALFCTDTGHYYEYVPGNLSWSEANTSASAKTFYGFKGYLVTITSERENAFVTSILPEGNSSWMGASDDYNGSDRWYWTTGPEAGTEFFYGLYYNDDWAVGPEYYGYSNWNENEPNNSDGIEYYGQFLSSGKWNDLPDIKGPNGYIVEYGGMPNDVSNLPTATVSIVVLNNSKLPIHAELKASYNNRLKTVNTLQTQILNKLPADCKQSGISSAGCSVSSNVKAMWNESEQYVQNAKKTGNMIKAVNDLKKAKELLEQILTKI
ncbi:MAG: Lectin C-type domain protein [Candidatus Methanofastidiosum methylothiophilum]|uniref:Lectin C-type domain protein n=1 Tax=Candidatus Methanofastidiosum methylothiophilum TaxID=1705564 RepID=A0A150INU7_9EURY|nr:MAG: Lectin C-type domain protein [Candidatus Methanofastidiosum methylthiophilus]KYC46627.1 MAG: Lectin C-type domain protein [Candidatus Methanofastidiosum methylthiophilus]KYC49115.1 MAG: Lectin C-type domain protein [Candidatus Methanofastidiosum methylthiophilus]